MGEGKERLAGGGVGGLEGNRIKARAGVFV